MFDFISLIGVLEHVPSPGEFLIDVARIMNKESILFLEVPNFKNNKADLLTADHLSKFTEECLHNLLAVSGFEVIGKNTEPVVPMQFVVKKTSKGKIRRFDVSPYVEQATSYLQKAISEGRRLSGREMALYGQGLLGDYLLGAGILTSSDLKCVIDDNHLYHSTKWRGLVPIVSFEEFRRKYNTPDIFLAMNDCYHAAVISRIPPGYHVWGTA
jgi:hypothetical protein